MAYLSNIANYLLLTPFDNKAQINDIESKIIKELSVGTFFDKCYSAPLFLDEDYLKTTLLLDENQSYEDSSTNVYEILDANDKTKKKYKNFYNWLSDSGNTKVYTISGNAGTGKTTFINYLKYIERKSKWVILDLAIADKFITWFGDIETTIENFDSPYKKMYAVILNNMYNLLFGMTSDDTEKSISRIYKALNVICESYKNKFLNTFPAGGTFFNELCEIIDSNQTELNIVKQTALFFKVYFDKKEKELTEENLFNKTLDVYLLILRCKNSDKTYIITFDNLERFINNKEIYNKDVDKIRKTLNEYSKKINKANNCNNGKFKFIMAIRTNTARMCDSNLQSSDELASDLDINGWFSTDSIIKKKKDWYKELKSVNNEIKRLNDEIILLEQITGDLRRCADNVLTGLKLQIDPLFNFNTRLIVDFFGILLESPSKQKYIKIYNELWKCDTAISRFAARSIIKGLILQELNENDNLFKHLKAYCDENVNNERGLGLGHSRKILTLLYNHTISGARENKLEINDVISDLFAVSKSKDSWNVISLKQQENIAEILYYMNSYNRKDNDWIQFIDMQYEKSEENVTLENYNELLEKLNVNSQKFTLRITHAGEAYLKYIVSSFEYFAVRYSDTYVPLFSTLPTKSTMGKKINVKDLECIKILDHVSENAINCIKHLRRDRDIKIILKAKQSGKLHKHRIIEQHKGYINNFIEFIIKYITKESMSETAQKNYLSVIEECVNIRNRYNKL